LAKSDVDFPASSPQVLGCGGTDLIAANGTIQQEVVWNDQPQGGGGISSVFPLPSWQAKPTSRRCLA
jgi:kumamolisin